MKIRHRDRLTDFLDPREREIIATIIGNDEDVKYRFFGGAPFSERARARLVPSYLEVTEEDFELALFSVRYSHKFATLTHRDVLGALMNIGVKREKFGDIIIAADEIQIVVANEIAPYVEMNVTKIGKTTVRLEPIPLSAIIQPDENWVSSIATVSSLRLDAILGQVYSLSRTKVVPYIEKGLVKVNWKVIDKPDFIVAQGDYLSMRGYGRAKITELLGKTKKDKIRFRYERLQ